MTESVFKYRNSSGDFVEGKIALEDYRVAANLGTNVRTVINRKYSDADPQFGTAWEQGLRSSGVFKKDNKDFGLKSTTIEAALSGDCMRSEGVFNLAGNSIVAPAGPVGNSTPSSRLFLPEVLMELVEENLQSDYSVEEGLFDQLLAESTSISGPVYTMPVINTEAPMAHDARPIGQNALPRNLVSITASETSQSIANEAVGLQISDQATQLSTLNLVSLIFAKQMEGAKTRRLWADLAMIVAGNPAAGESALSAVEFSTYDSDATSGSITHKGWMKALWQNGTRTVSYNAMICTLDDYLAVQNRTGRPLMFDPAIDTPNTGNAGNYGLDVTMTAPANFAQLGVPFVFIVPSGLWAAQNILLFDTRYALRRVINAMASYSASQQMIMQRVTNVRIDWGLIIHRIFEDAFLLVDYS